MKADGFHDKPGKAQLVSCRPARLSIEVRAMFQLGLSPKLVILTFMLGLAHPAAAESEVVALMDKSGAALTVRLVTCDGTNLTITRQSDGKTFTIPLERLDAASNETVKAWIAKGGNLTTKYAFAVETGKNRRTTGAEDFDDKRVNLDPVITVRNPHTTLSSSEAKVTVLFLGRPVVDSSWLFVISKATFDLPKLTPLTSQNFPVGPVTCAYDDRGYSKFGARYLGYAIIVHDADGKKTFDSVSVPAAVLDGRELQFIALKKGATYDRNFKALPQMP